MNEPIGEQMGGVGQEWTAESVKELTSYGVVGREAKLIADAHNAELAAEQKKREQAEAMMFDAYAKARVMRTELAAFVK